ncbi:hypothetical protein ES708_26183 [subsurface metagenome]
MKATTMKATTKYPRYKKQRKPKAKPGRLFEKGHMTEEQKDSLARREREAMALAEAKGYEVIQYGWPDMLLWREKDGKAVFLEVKAKTKKGQEPREGANTLRPSQCRMHSILKRLGLNVQVIWIE